MPAGLDVHSPFALLPGLAADFVAVGGQHQLVPLGEWVAVDRAVRPDLNGHLVPVVGLELRQPPVFAAALEAAGVKTISKTEVIRDVRLA